MFSSKQSIGSLISKKTVDSSLYDWIHKFSTRLFRAKVIDSFTIRFNNQAQSIIRRDLTAVQINDTLEKYELWLEKPEKRHHKK